MADARATASLLVEAIPPLMHQVKRQLDAGKHGLSIAQFRCLMMVKRCPDVALGELAESNGVSAPAMSKLVDGLVSDGLLDRREHEDDRRKLQLTVTPAGRKAVGAVSDALKDSLAAQLSALKAADLDALFRGLSSLSTVLQPQVTA